MDIHEYQAKEIFRGAGIPVPPGEVATTADEAETIAGKYDGMVVVKAQVHSGGRGKAGGVKLAESPAEARSHAEAILGMQISGLTVEKVLVTPAEDIETEAYVGVLIDRNEQRPVFMVSPEGGIDIEHVAEENPEAIRKLHVDPRYGLLPHQAYWLANFLYQDKGQAKQATRIMTQLYQAFSDSGASMAEINPLIVTPSGDVKLDGDVGCCVNGAGLAMATMDLVKYYGGEPANFLDIGGSSNPDKVVAALEIITDDPNVKVILFNIFGGITRCDDVANGIVEATRRIDIEVPIVIRLTGTNEEEALEILKENGFSAYTSMDEVVEKAVELAGGGAAGTGHDDSATDA